MKLSQIVKYSGIVVGAIMAYFLIMPVLAQLTKHPVMILILGLGALAYFIGVWLGKQGK